MIDLKNLPKELSLVPLKDTIVFPQAILSIYITDKKSKELVSQAYEQNKLIFTSAFETSNADSSNVYKVGCASLIMRMKNTSDGKIKILIQGICRATIKKFSKDFSKVELDYFIENIEDTVSAKQNKAVEEIKSLLKELSRFKESLSPEFLLVISSIKNPGQICDLILGNLDLKSEELQKKLETFDVNERLRVVKNSILNEMEISKLQGRIHSLLKKELPKPFINPFENKQYQAGRNNSPKKEEFSLLATQIEEKDLPDHVKKEATKQLNRLEKMHSESSESSMVRNYIDWLLELPWSKKTEDNLDLENAKKILDKDHYGLEKSKERILEFLAVRSLKTSGLTGPILCFAGPPGVGKTSLGKSIAEAMGRSYHRISLGGVKDEGEIRGHRRTYVGSMPGKIIQALKSCQTNNPVIILDEIDKLGNDFRGDPSAALLEVLDPEQNHCFKDHYLNLDFDLSQVLFITTANALQNISSALRDRLEIISVSGYTQTEKVEISKKYLIKKEIESNGLPKNHVKFTDEGIKHLINSYTQEAGLRNLKREVSSVCRKIAKGYVLGNKKIQSVDKKLISNLLGSPYFIPEEALTEDKIGIATGLAWTEAGGQILYVEAIRVKSKKSGLRLTGQLGDVMKESAQASLSYIKSFTEDSIKPEWFEENEIHVHLPSGAIPKDGPSAGVTLSCALLSLIAGIPVRRDIAMTGEISLSGRVMPVGGIKEKVLAAYNKGIKTIVLPKQNAKDLEDIRKEQRDEITFIFVSHLEDLFKVVFTQPKKQSIKDVLENQRLDGVA